MPSPLYHVGAAALCAHGGSVSVISFNARVMVHGMPAATLADLAIVAGCPFNVGGVEQPCLRVQWVTPAVRIWINGQPALLQHSVGLALNPTKVPQGPITIISTQSRVMGS